MRMHDVLILGAGVSGLTLSWRLQGRRQVAVREARPRTGGRTFSRSLGDRRYDLGATWVWGHETAVLDLLEQLEVGTFPAFEDGDDLFEQSPGTTHRIRLPRSWSPTKRIQGGTQAITDRLVALQPELDLALGQRALRIEDQVDHVKVVFADGHEESARHVVAAYPPALLSGQIGVEPTVREALRCTPVWMGDIAKVVAGYATPFWRDLGLSGRALVPGGPMVEVHDMSAPHGPNPAALFGFIPRQARLSTGESADSASSVVLEAEVRAQLARLFGASASAPDPLIIHPWWNEADTIPADVPAVDERLFGHAQWRQPMFGGRLHLASTETAEENTGHIDGAVRRANVLAEQLGG